MSGFLYLRLMRKVEIKSVHFTKNLVIGEDLSLSTIENSVLGHLMCFNQVLELIIDDCLFDTNLSYGPLIELYYDMNDFPIEDDGQGNAWMSNQLHTYINETTFRNNASESNGLIYSKVAA
mmetsp:Transcript_19395/g.3164  ORF Transcript_19395/g.3164 Transcript_19395/m.3164 type:complete len:121 (+) Transcript_19395:1064-1426(+)